MSVGIGDLADLVLLHGFAEIIGEVGPNLGAPPEETSGG